MKKLGWLTQWQRTAQRQLMTAFGTIKYFQRPPVLVIDPGSYRVNGTDCRTLLGVLQPGDILLRGYTHFIDGWFIRRSVITDPKGPKQIFPGTFTHVAMYVGPLTADDAPRIAADLKGYSFDTGQEPAGEDALEKIKKEMRDKYIDAITADNQMVIHAMADGVKIEDILTFTRCDQLVVLRLPKVIVRQTDDVLAPTPIDQRMPAESKAIEGALLRDESVERQTVIAEVIRLALGKVGAEYDFACNDTKEHHYFSCAELVYFCFASVRTFLAISCWEHAFLRLFGRRVTITPDDFLYSNLELVWHSSSLNHWKETVWEKIREKAQAR